MKLSNFCFSLNSRLSERNISDLVQGTDRNFDSKCINIFFIDINSRYDAAFDLDSSSHDLLLANKNLGLKSRL